MQMETPADSWLFHNRRVRSRQPWNPVNVNKAPLSTYFIGPLVPFWDKHNAVDQRWANSVLMTEYEYEYYSVSQKWPNTNTNIIRFPKNDRIWIQILFVSQKWPNTNTNIIRFPKNDRMRIRILFGFPKITQYEYEYHLATQKLTRYKCKQCF